MTDLECVKDVNKLKSCASLQSGKSGIVFSGCWLCWQGCRTERAFEGVEWLGAARAGNSIARIEYRALVQDS
jgi:hypothetical protein